MHGLKSRDVGFALLAAVLFGLSTPLSKVLLAQVAPSVLAGLLYLGSGLGLALIAGRERQEAEAPLRRSDLPCLAGSILCGGVAAPLLLMVGLARTDSGTASLALNLEGVFTTLLAWFVFGEGFDRRVALGMMCIVGGGSLLSWSGSATASWGLLYVALACIAWAMDNNLTRQLSGGNPTQIAMAKGLVAGPVNLALALLGEQASWPRWSALGGAALVGLVCYGLSLRLYVRALRGLGAARTGAYFSLAPFVGATLSYLVLGEPLGRFHLLAALLMALGLCLHLVEDHEHEHVHPFEEHEHAHTHDDGHHDHEHEHRGDPRLPHSHFHAHAPRMHTHAHFPDLHHIHAHADPS